ncbi:MAG: hypothetical protein H6R17_3175 [Proteobacteria bacterium]|nr:hypothetical protein [Pseudomonadota bacterium]
MKTNQARSQVLAALAITLLAGCATRPAVNVPAPPAAVADVDEKIVKVDESSMLPLLGYLQLLAQLSPPELARERAVLLYIPPTPSTQLRLAMLFGQTRAPADLQRALALLDKILRSSEPAAASMHPLARLLTNQYQERLRLQGQGERLQAQSERLQAQNERLTLQLSESQRHSSELQDKLDALADVERSLPARPSGRETAPGAAR